MTVKKNPVPIKQNLGYPIILSHAAFGRLRLSAAPQHGADHAALSGVVAVFAVILAIQLFAGTIGGRSDSGLSCASLSLCDTQMK